VSFRRDFFSVILAKKPTVVEIRIREVNFDIAFRGESTFDNRIDFGLTERTFKDDLSIFFYKAGPGLNRESRPRPFEIAFEIATTKPLRRFTFLFTVQF
jgi:hypothetical protein